MPHTAHKLLTPGHRSGDPWPPGRETPPPPPGQSPEKFVYVYVPLPFLKEARKSWGKGSRNFGEDREPANTQKKQLILLVVNMTANLGKRRNFVPKEPALSGHHSELAGEGLQTGFSRHGLPPQRAPLDTVYPLRGDPKSDFSPPSQKINFRVTLGVKAGISTKNTEKNTPPPPAEILEPPKNTPQIPKKYPKWAFLVFFGHFFFVFSGYFGGKFRESRISPRVFFSVFVVEIPGWAISRERAEYCFESTVSEDRTH